MRLSEIGAAVPGSSGLSRRTLARLSLAILAAAAMPLALAAPKPVILVLGDSISAEYGLKRGSGWVDLLKARLAQEKIAASVVNASISGDTTAGGRARLGALLKQHQPSHVIIELGGNDALRGMALDSTQANLAAMTQASKAAKARVLMLGIQVPPNYGGDYSRRFAGTFVAVGKSEKVPLVPFFLKGVADVPEAASLFQPDRIHPNEQAQSILLDNVWPDLKKLLQDKAGK